MKILFYYVRYSLMIYIVAMLFLPLLLIKGDSLPENIEWIFYITILFCFPAFFLLPGIIYEGDYKSSYHGFTPDQLKYSFFVGLTLGFGPILVYFLKHDKILKKIIKGQDEERN